MTKYILAIYDITAQQYGQVITAPNVGTVTRELTDMLREGNNTISKHPGDFALYHVGWFDDESGYVERTNEPEKLYSLASLLPQSS